MKGLECELGQDRTQLERMSSVNLNKVLSS